MRRCHSIRIFYAGSCSIALQKLNGNSVASRGGKMQWRPAGKQRSIALGWVFLDKQLVWVSATLKQKAHGIETAEPLSLLQCTRLSSRNAVSQKYFCHTRISGSACKA